MAIDIGDAIITIRGDASMLNRILERDIPRRAKTSSNIIKGVFQGMGIGIFQTLTRVLFKPVDLAFRGMAIAAQATARQIAAGARAAASIELALAEVGTLGVKNMERLYAGVRAVSEEVGENAVKMIRALYQAISAGIPEVNVLDFLRTAAKSAIAGLTDTETMVNALSSVIASFGLKVSKAVKVSDKFFATIKMGKTVAGELAPVIGRIAPLAATAGLTLNEMFASIARITQTGIATAEAVTGLRGAIKFLVKPTAAAQEVFQRWGTTLDALRTRVGKEGLIGLLKKAQKERVLTSLVEDVEGLNAAFALLGKDEGKKTVKAIKSIAGASKAAKTAYERIADTTKRQLARLKTIWENWRAAMMSGFNLLFKGIIEASTRHIPRILQPWEEVATKLSGILMKVFRIEETIPPPSREQLLKEYGAFGGTMAQAVETGVTDWSKETSWDWHAEMVKYQIEKAKEEEKGGPLWQLAEKMSTTLADSILAILRRDKPMDQIVAEWIDESWPAIKAKWGEFIESDIFKRIEEGWNRIKPELVRTIEIVFTAMGEAAWQAFKNIWMRNVAAWTARMFAPFTDFFYGVLPALPPGTEDPGGLIRWRARTEPPGEPTTPTPEPSPEPTETAGIRPMGQTNITIPITITGGDPGQIVSVINEAIRRGAIERAPAFA